MPLRSSSLNALSLSPEERKRLTAAKRRLTEKKGKLLEKIISALRPVVKDGRLPKNKELRRLSLSWITKAFGQFHEIGMRDGIAEILGARSYRRHGKKLNKWSIVKSELLPICEKLGHMPGSEYLSQNRKTDIIVAIQRFHGGVGAVAKKLGYPTAQVEYGYWDNFENIRATLTPIFVRAGRALQTSEIKQHPNKWVRALLNFVKRHGGYPEICAQLGFPLKGYFKTHADYFVNSRGEYCISNFLHSRRIPHEPQPLIKKGRKYLGDFSVGGQFLIEFLGEMDKWAYRNRWKKKQRLIRQQTKWKLIVVQPKDVDPKLGEKGIDRSLEDLFSKILATVPSNGKRHLTPAVKYTLPAGYWSDWENFWKELEPYCDHKNKLLPTQGELRLRGRGGIAHAYKYFGHTAGVERKTGYRAASRLPSGGFGKRGLRKYTFEDVVAEYKKACRGSGRRLGDADLKGSGLRRIKHRIVSLGTSLREVSTAAGFPPQERPKGFWENRESAVFCIAEVARELGRYPTVKELTRHGLSTISTRYKKLGGRALFVRDVIRQARHARGTKSLGI